MTKTDYLDVATKMIKEAGKIVLKYKNCQKIIKSKSDPLDVVTDVDYQVEKYLINSINQNFPGHHILSEETENKFNTVSGFNWIIDPLDGTKEYVRNIYDYSINIAFEYNNNLLLGIVYFPEIDQIYISQKCKGVEHNNNLVKVSQVNKINNSIIYIHLPDSRWTKKGLKDFSQQQLAFIKNIYRLRSKAHDCESLCFIAKGAAEGYFLPPLEMRGTAGPKWWDVAPGILMIQEAGGMVTDVHGKAIVNHDLSNGLVASNKLIHSQLLQLVK